MKDLGGRPVITHTFENTLSTGLFDEVIVVTDHDAIEAAVKRINGRVIRSRTAHASGTDRIAEAVALLPEAEILVNVQGDEPFVETATLKALLEAFEGTSGKSVQVASLMHPLHSIDDANNPNFVKVVTDTQDFALYFSRSRIPYCRDGKNSGPWFRHIGIYGFRREALLNFPRLRPTPLEQIERLEQLRFLENGVPIKMVRSTGSSLGIDVPADLELARKALQSGN